VNSKISPIYVILGPKNKQTYSIFQLQFKLNVSLTNKVFYITKFLTCFFEFIHPNDDACLKNICKPDDFINRPQSDLPGKGAPTRNPINIKPYAALILHDKINAFLNEAPVFITCLFSASYTERIPLRATHDILREECRLRVSFVKIMRIKFSMCDVCEQMNI